MAEFFRDYAEARGAAQAKADRLGLDVAIRATKEYGHRGFAVHLASRNDSDYALAEIVRPAPGKEWKRNPALGKLSPAEARQLAHAHLASPEVRAWRKAHPDAKPVDILGDEWDWWRWSDPDAARGLVLDAIRNALGRAGVGRGQRKNPDGWHERLPYCARKRGFAWGWIGGARSAAGASRIREGAEHAKVKEARSADLRRRLAAARRSNPRGGLIGHAAAMRIARRVITGHLQGRQVIIRNVETTWEKALGPEWDGRLRSAVAAARRDYAESLMRGR